MESLSVGGNDSGAQAYKPSKPMPTDAELIRAARNDPDAFTELYCRHACAVNGFLRSRVPGRVAGELTAETFAQAALGLRRFRDEADGSALPWLYGIARNLLRTFYERERIESTARLKLGLPRDNYELDVQAMNDRLDAERLAPRLSRALDSLPTSQRRALELRVVEELPYRQVASSLGCSEVAARIRVTRALGSLSRLLKGAPL
jgi:RNA polymerase sigma factor (sigma-70 family)